MLPFAISHKNNIQGKNNPGTMHRQDRKWAALLVVFVVVVVAVVATIHSAEDIRHRKAKKQQQQQQLQKPQLMGRHKCILYYTLFIHVFIVFILACVCMCACVCSRPFPNTLDAIIFACSRIDDTSFCLSVCQSVTEAVSQKHLQGSSWHASQKYRHLFLSISLSGQPQICINCEKSSLSRIFWTLCGCAAPKFQM